MHYFDKHLRSSNAFKKCLNGICVQECCVCMVHFVESWGVPNRPFDSCMKKIILEIGLRKLEW